MLIVGSRLYKLLNCGMLSQSVYRSCNTIVRRPIDGKLISYNTNCEASITAIEDALRGTVIIEVLLS